MNKLLAQNLNSIGIDAGLHKTIMDDKLGTWITNLIRYVFGAAGIILLFMLISAGYGMIFSKGDPKAMEAAKAKITTSMIGIIILFASFWIVQLVFSFLGVDSTIQIFN